MLGLGYPGGPAIEQIARGGDRKAMKFPIAKISDGKPDFSFSGLKTAVSRYLRENGLTRSTNGETAQWTKDVAAAVQDSIIRSLAKTMEAASEISGQKR